MIIRIFLIVFLGKLESKIEMYVLRRSYKEEIVENIMGVIELFSGSIFYKVVLELYFLKVSGLL